ncbi:MAG TPA: ATP-binding protein [Fulvivirga sp.]|nr:ATP-binding protein [Fulvivirga sp.]
MDGKSLKDYLAKGLFYKAVVEDGSDIIFIVDYKGNILYHNPSVEETLGHAPSSLVNENFFDYIKPSTLKEFKREFDQSISKPYDESIEFRFLCKDGTYRYLEFNSINLQHKEGVQALILDCRDITQRKKDAEELLRAQKAKEQFLANMSHEIRTPINGISGMVNLLSETNSEEEKKKYLNAIKNSTESLKVIINDILDLSVIESGKLKLEKIGFNIKDRLSAVLDTFLYTSKEKGIGLKYSISTEVNDVLLGDPARLNQILINLIGNAVKFTHIGEIIIDVSLLKENKKYSHIKFEVKDTGVGIPADKIHRIFDSFTQADASVTRRYGGTGLGLTIVKQLVELQNGTIKVESKENKGTTFTFIIPYEKGTSNDLVFQSNQNHDITQHSFKDLNVLLVEDNEINRLYATNILKKWHCNVDGAENGYMAIEKLKKSDFDIILMDVQMPIMDGFEATRIIRKFDDPIKAGIPIIALTANAIKGDNEKCFDVGMNDYLSKPFHPESLFIVISKHVDQTKLAEQSRNISSNNKVTNLSYLSSVCDGDQDFIRDMIETFIKNTPPILTEMKNMAANAKWSELSDLAHKLKPSITFVGLESAKELVQAIELSGNTANQTKNMEAMINDLSSIVKVAIEELKQEI